MPARLKRERTAGWTLAEATANPFGAQIVDRTSRYGNPFKIGVDADDAAHATALFWEWLATNSPTVYNPYAGAAYLDAMNARRDWILTHIHELRGKDLACFCDLPAEGEEDHCHGQVLLLLSNDYFAPAGSGVCDQCWQWDARPDLYPRCPGCGRVWDRVLPAEALA